MFPFTVDINTSSWPSKSLAYKPKSKERTTRFYVQDFDTSTFLSHASQIVWFAIGIFFTHSRSNHLFRPFAGCTKSQHGRTREIVRRHFHLVLRVHPWSTLLAYLPPLCPSLSHTDTDTSNQGRPNFHHVAPLCGLWQVGQVARLHRMPPRLGRS